METKNIYFISGIDTDAGKSYCTAWYARELMQRPAAWRIMPR